MSETAKTCARGESSAHLIDDAQLLSSGEPLLKVERARRRLRVVLNTKRLERAIQAQQRVLQSALGARRVAIAGEEAREASDRELIVCQAHQRRRVGTATE